MIKVFVWRGWSGGLTHEKVRKHEMHFLKTPATYVTSTWHSPQMVHGTYELKMGRLYFVVSFTELKTPYKAPKFTYLLLLLQSNYPNKHDFTQPNILFKSNQMNLTSNLHLLNLSISRFVCVYCIIKPDNDVINRWR